jgi:drug/metabolite transporter (DMT)-like permease
LSGPAIGVGLYQWGLAVAPSGVVLSIVATTPLAVMPLAWALDGKKPGKRAMGGSVLAVAGVIGLIQSR